jgi:tetratricopeptide (TPR) repeat protein
LLAAVAVAAAVPFLPAVRGEFVNWDDLENFVSNPGYRGLGWTQIRWMFTSTLMGHWIPLTWLSLGLNYALGGMDPTGYHVLNQLLHVANALLVALVARRLLARGLGDGPAADWGAALAAAVFAAHPLRSESVAWITERRDVLSGLFYLLVVLVYLGGARPDRALSGRRLAACTGLYACALMSKSMTMTLPATLLLLDVYPLRRLGLGGRALLREKLPLVVLALAGAIVAVFAVARGAVFTGYTERGLEERVALVAYNLWFYPAKMLWPIGLSPLYELPPRLSLAEGRFLLPLVAVVAVSLALGAAWRRWPAGLAAWLHSAIVLGPVSGVVHAGHQLAHDRYSYLSGLGFAVLAGAVLGLVLRSRQAGRIGRGTAAAARAGAGVAVLLLGLGAWGQSGIWRSGESLWAAALAAEPDCVLCHNNLGYVYLGQKRWAEAEYHFRRAVALRPERANSHNNLGTALANQGRYREAEAAFLEAMRWATRRIDGLANLGSLYARAGRNDEAVPLLRQAWLLDPGFPGVRANLGHALANQGAARANAGRVDEAVAPLTEAVRLVPDDPGVRRNLGQALVAVGRPAEALPHLERAVALDPRGTAQRFWLARAYLALGQPARAEPHRRALAELAPDMARQLDAPAR